ncbi:MAG: glycosyl hydrolase family 28 protein [Bacteroidota bacterium]|nr:glycosyl hydrolase family 28 protein [Bacteroidota bacterium]
MKLKRIVCFFVAISFLIYCNKSFSQPGSNSDLSWTKDAGAKKFPVSKGIFIVKSTSDTSKVISKQIQETIDKCAKDGGGIVSFKPGIYVTGAIYLKTNVNLQIDKGVTLLGSQSFADYPEINTRIAGIEMKWPSALINVIDAKNAAVTGEGIVNARGKFCWDKYWIMRKDYDKKGLRWIVDYDARRIRTILVQNSSDISLEGVTLKNAGFWTVQVLYSNHVTVGDLIIRNNEDGHGPSTDGVDIDSSTWVLIENCDIDCNDDNICLKAGRDWDGLRVNKPTEYIVIKKCVARRGGGLVTLGSETSGGIRHVLATDLFAKHTDNGLRIKSAFTRGGVIEDIHFTNTVLDSVNNAFQINLNWNPSYSYSELPKGYNPDSIPAHWKAMLHKVTPAEKGIPHAKDIYIENVKVTHANHAFVGSGYKESVLENFVFTNCDITAGAIGLFEFTKDWKFNNVNISIDERDKISVDSNGKAQQERLKN